MATYTTKLKRLLGLTSRGRGRLPSADDKGAIPAGRGVGARDEGGGGSGGLSSLTELVGERVLYSDEEFADTSGLFVIVSQPIQYTVFAGLDGSQLSVTYQRPTNTAEDVS